MSANLPGVNLPAKGIDKNLPELAPSASVSFSPALEKKIKEQMENTPVPVQDLKLFQNGESWVPMLAMINRAQKFLYLNFLSFTCDERTEDMVRAIESRARANVDVRLIVNKGFSILSKSCLDRLEKSGVKVLRTKAHSSYLINDAEELMIGGQSIARMFFNSNGFNSLDRDMMISAKGAIASQAIKDFVGIWYEESTEDLGLIKVYRDSLNWKSESSNSRCLFASQRPKEGVRELEKLIQLAVSENKQELYFSGAKVDSGDHKIGKLLQQKSINGMQVHYIGNGYLSGNGELSMVFDEWSQYLKNSAFSFFAPVIEGIKLWDNRRVALENKKLYDHLVGDSSIKIWTYFNFVHHKVWLFDGPAFLVGSANFDQEKFQSVTDAGIFCLDQSVHDQLKKELLRDKRNSVAYEPLKKRENKR